MNHFQEIFKAENSKTPLTATLVRTQRKRFIQAVSTAQNFTISYTIAPSANNNNNNNKDDSHNVTMKEDGGIKTIPQLVVPPTFTSFQLNRVDTGSESFQRSSPHIFLRAIKYNLLVEARGQERGGFLRYGLLYDKYSNGTSNYNGSEIFSTIQDTPGGNPVFSSDETSFRNMDNIKRFIVISDKMINFSTNTITQNPSSLVKKIVQYPAGDYYEDTALSLEPLMTVYKATSSSGSSSEITNGNLVFWFLPDTDVNPLLEMKIGLMVRLEFSSFDTGFDRFRRITYLSNPDAVGLMTALRDRDNRGNSAFYASVRDEMKSLLLQGTAITSDKNVSSHFEYASTAYQIIHSSHKEHSSFGIEHGVSNGLCYLIGSQLSEVKFFDTSLKTQVIVYRKNQDVSNKSLTHLINAVNPGTAPFQRVNARLRMMMIDYRIQINKTFSLNEITDVDDTNIPIVYTVAVIYDKAPQWDDTTNMNIVPDIKEMFSGVDYLGQSIESPFKTVENSNRFVFLHSEQIFSDTANDVTNLYLGLGTKFLQNTIKLYDRSEFSSPIVDNIVDGPQFSNTRESAQNLSQGFTTEFNPAKERNSITIYNMITYGALYLVVKTQELPETYPDYNVTADLSTRVYYYD